ASVYSQCIEPRRNCVYPDPNLPTGIHRSHFRLNTQCTDLSILSLKAGPFAPPGPTQRFEFLRCLFDVELYRFRDSQDSPCNSLSTVRLDPRFWPDRDFRIRVGGYPLSVSQKDGQPWIFFIVR